MATNNRLDNNRNESSVIPFAPALCREAPADRARDYSENLCNFETKCFSLRKMEFLKCYFHDIIYLYSRVRRRVVAVINDL